MAEEVGEVAEREGSTAKAEEHLVAAAAAAGSAVEGVAGKVARVGCLGP